MSGFLDNTNHTIPFIMEGLVVASNDPDEMGRLKIYTPALDGESFDPDSLPWTEYAPLFGGFTVDYPAGGYPVDNKSHSAYGLWAVPKLGSTVLIFCLNADPKRRFYFASTPRLHRNRSLPAGRNKDDKGNPGPWGDAGDEQGNLIPIEPAYSNLRQQFDGKVEDPEALSRGATERQAAQAKTNKDDTEGYSKNPADASYLDSQTYCFVSPGRHAWIMQDDPRWSRFRIKTAEGNQIIFDDTNERIYISTAVGKSWVELDKDGHVHIFAAESISMRSGRDINMYAERDVNIEANNALNIKTNTADMRVSTAGSFHVTTTKDLKLTSCGVLDLSVSKDLKISSEQSLHIKSGQGTFITGGAGIDLNGGPKLIESAGVIHLNGPVATKAQAAGCAEPASSPTIVPGHEPWPRPPAAIKRGPNWKK